MALPVEIYQRIVNAKLFIDENYHEPIGLHDISKRAYLSRYHFHRLFTRIYRTTPHQYLTRRRIDQAKKLLACEQLSISEICTEVGFESLGSFSVLFKKEIGFTPSYYRNKAWQKKQQGAQQPKSQIPGCFLHMYHFDIPPEQ